MVLEKTEQAQSRRGFQRSFARQMRHEPTEAEKLFWWEVKDRRLSGHKFKRQYLIGRYIVDFVCLEQKLVIELDGGRHSEMTEVDEQRSTFLRSQGFHVMRFWNFDVLTNMEGVVDTILAELGGEAGSPSP